MCSGFNPVLGKEHFHLIDIEVGKDEFSVGEGGSTGLTGELLHLGIPGAVGDDIDTFIGKSLALEISNGIDAPGASGFEVDFECWHFGSGN